MGRVGRGCVLKAVRRDDGGILESIRNLMKQTGWPLEKALTMLDIPEDEHEKYLKLLEK